MVQGSGLRPFEFDGGNLPPVRKPEQRTIPAWLLLIAVFGVGALTAVGVFLYYNAKADTFDNTVRGDTQLAVQNLQYYLNTAAPGTVLTAATPGLNLPTAHGTQYEITGPGGQGVATNTSYELHAWNVKSRSYPSNTKYYLFSSATNSYSGAA